MAKDTTAISIDRIGGKQMLELLEPKVNNKPVPLRTIVEGMKDKAEALEYAIAAYENVTGAIDQERCAIVGEFKLTSAESIIFNFLYQRRTRIVTRGALIDCYHAALTTGSLPTDKIIDVYIFKTRNKIKGSRFRIETIRGIGYRLIEE